MSSISRATSITLRAAATETTDGNTGELTGTAVIPMASAISLFLSVTAFSGTTAATDGFQVYLDTSPDGGTTWFPAEKFATVITSTATQTINMRPTGIGAVEAATVNVDSAAITADGVARNTVLGPTNRIRWTVPGSGSPSVTFGVFANCQPMGSNPAC